MSDQPLLLGIDVGTSSTKAVLIRLDGTVVATAAPEYKFHTPKPLWAESDPEDWWEASIQAIRQVIRKGGVNGESIAAIGLTGQMHGLVLLGSKGEVLRPCIMWNDQRTAEECAEITTSVGADKVLSITGNPVLPGFTAPKIAWVKKHEPTVFAKIKHILLPKDYVRYRLSGELAMDVADGSGTSLMEVGSRKWSAEMVDATGVDPKWLPPLMESVEISGHLSEEAAIATGLKAGIPIAAGAGDQAAQAVGSGIFEEGKISATFGTSGVVFAHSKEFRVEPEGNLHAFCSAVPGEWHLMGVMLSAAGSFQWFRNALGRTELALEEQGRGKAYDLLVEKAASVPAGCEGLLFLPYLSGERTPYPDPLARGAFIGLTLRHAKGHMVRSVLEGITFGMNDSLQLMTHLGIQPEEVVVSGGGAQNPFWRQMMADVFAQRVVTVNATEGAAFGAALLGGVCSGHYPDVATACKSTIQNTAEASPGVDAELYGRLYPRYRALYPALKDEFHATSKMFLD